MIKEDEERAWYKETHAKAAADCANGWYVDWELVVVVGRKEG
jgi:hypothetical protein